MEFSHIICGDARWYDQFGKQFDSFLKLTMCLPYDPTIPLLDTYPRETKFYVCTKTCIQIFIEAIVIVGKN